MAAEGDVELEAKNPAVEKRQMLLIEAMRRNDYNLSAALEASRITETLFRNWYVHDTDFKKAWDALEDEDVIFMRQTLREMAKGTHRSAPGKPDKTLLRYVVAEYDKRKKKIADDSDGIVDDLDGLTEDDLKKALGEMEG